MHVADVDEIGCTQPVQGVCRGLVEKPPASGERRARQPRVEHEPPLSQLQLHAGVGQVHHLGEEGTVLQMADVTLLPRWLATL